MDALEPVRRQAYADGLCGVKPLRMMWLGADEFSRAYCEAWTAGALAATAPATPSVTPSVAGTIRATFSC